MITIAGAVLAKVFLLGVVLGCTLSYVVVAVLCVYEVLVPRKHHRYICEILDSQIENLEDKNDFYVEQIEQLKRQVQEARR